MASKRAKPETKRAPTTTVFTITHIVAYICSFVPSTQLPNVKRTNKVAKLAIEKTATLDERWERGTLEQYLRLEWIRDRASHLNSTVSRKPFTVCFDCKGYNEDVDVSWAEWLSVTDVKSIQCWACKVLSRELGTAHLLETVRDKRKALQLEYERGFGPDEADRELVQDEEHYDPDKNLGLLRGLFPFDPSESDETDEEEKETDEETEDD